MITSTQNERVKLVHALQTQAKARRREGRVALEGARLVDDAMERSGSRPDFVLYEPDSADKGLVDRLERQRVAVLPVTPAVMKHMSATESPPGIIGVFPLPAPTLPAQPDRVLILDDIRDPGNLGTILRTAAAADVGVVLLSPGSVDPYNPKVLRGGMGAHFRLIVAEKSWAEIATICQGLRIYLATGDGELPYDRADWTQGWALIVGSEAHGAGPEAQRLAQTRVVIPIAGETESLNAAVATAVLLFEAQRQRRAAPSG